SRSSAATSGGCTASATCARTSTSSWAPTTCSWSWSCAARRDGSRASPTRCRPSRGGCTTCAPAATWTPRWRCTPSCSRSSPGTPSRSSCRRSSWPWRWRDGTADRVARLADRCRPSRSSRSAGTCGAPWPRRPPWRVPPSERPHRGTAVRSRLVLHAVDSHTEGMPTRVVTGGVGTLPGSTMWERRQLFERDRDGLRRLLMYEPRGHSAMSGAILQPPTRPDADVGVLFIEVSGCLPMCGHGTIGVATVLVETGMVPVVEPVTTIRLDTPAGLVEAGVAAEDGRARSVTLRNVASFLLAADQTVEVGGDVGTVRYDMAFGGNFDAIVEADQLGLPVAPAAVPELIRRGLAVMKAINEQASPTHPVNPEIEGCRHVQVVAPGRDGADGRAAVVIHPGWVDRSPCGTGTSARMAQRHARGLLGLDTPYVHESVLGTRFVGRLVETTP